MKRHLLSIGLLVLTSAPLLAQDDVETRAMRDELQRSMKDLHLDSTDGPYYIAYKIVDSDRKEAQAILGSLVATDEARSRTLTVQVRVGNYDFDSSNSNGGMASLTALLSSIGGGNVLPVDDSYDELRRKIWLATDAAYKKAVEDLSAKKAAQQNRNREETLADFSREPARAESESLPQINENLADAERIVRESSAVFRTLPLLQTSEAVFEVENTTERFLNSEGTDYTRQVPEVFFRASATLQTRSGEVFSDSYSTYGRALSDLPDETALVKDSKDVVERMNLRRGGMAATRYSGPVLVEKEAAPELFAHNFANQLAARGRAGAGGGATAAANALVAALLGGSGGGAAASGALLNKVGSRVFPDFLTVVDNPQLTQLEGHPLSGNYKFDEEGVPSRETVLIKDGILKTLLTSRTPARGMPQSTGNMREQGVLPGNLIVEASKSSSRDDLRKQLIDLVKARGLDYGIIVRRLSNLQALEAVRLYPDGHEEPIRDSRVSEITVASFKDILAVSNERTFYTESGQGALAGLGLGSAGDLVTYVVPDMLFEDMTVERMADNGPKPPDISSPLASN